MTEDKNTDLLKEARDAVDYLMEINANLIARGNDGVRVDSVKDAIEYHERLAVLLSKLDAAIEEDIK